MESKGKAEAKVLLLFSTYETLMQKAKKFDALEAEREGGSNVTNEHYGSEEAAEGLAGAGAVPGALVGLPGGRSVPGRPYLIPPSAPILVDQRPPPPIPQTETDLIVSNQAAVKQAELIHPLPPLIGPPSLPKEKRSPASTSHQPKKKTRHSQKRAGKSGSGSEEEDEYWFIGLPPYVKDT